MIEFKVFSYEPYIGYFPGEYGLDRSNYEDPIDSFWNMLEEHYDWRETHKKFNVDKVSWLIQNGIPFLVRCIPVGDHEFPTFVDGKEYLSCASYRIVIPNEEDALMFKLVHGNV